ncbi:MAG: tetratricopeptide repeat protein [Kovacikia sp.]
MTTIAELFATAFQHHQAGLVGQAMQLYQQVLQQQPNHAGALNLMGVIVCQSGDLPQGVSLYQRAVAAKPDFMEAHFNLAMALEMVGQLDAAIGHYRMALSLQPNQPELHNNLGNLLTRQGKVEEGMGHFRQALAIQPTYAPAHINLGALLAGIGKPDEAIAHLQQALQLQPNAVLAYHHLGHLLNSQGRLDEAASHFQQALALQPTPECHFSLGKTLEEQGRTEEAIAHFHAARQLKPDFAAAFWQEQLVLPVLYDTPEQIRFYRQRFCQNLSHLIAQTNLNTPEDRLFALQGMASRTNFYLAYQGFDDRELQCEYGQLVHRIMAANYPQWANEGIGSRRQGGGEQRTHPTPRPPGHKIRVGYLSAHLMAHSAAAWVRGWIREHDRDRFEIYCYHINQRVDFITQEFHEISDVFRLIPGSLETICPQVLADQLDVLVLTDIGMDPQTTQLAGLRLAPVQCTAWGHPVTSGIPTIDYYLSSQLMEPENAQAHYSEKLILLPNIGICYPKPPLPETQRTRAEFGLRQDAVVYLCFQSPYKYLPQYDRVFAQIAQHVPQAQFVFLRHSSTQIVERFASRLRRAFAASGLNSADYCVFLPKLDRDSYWSLNRICDVFLDSFEWSGGNSTLEAIAYGLPVVTCPGKFMRGRHSAAILQMLGIPELIASTAEDYVGISVGLGLDPNWRKEISQTIVAHHPQLYDDRTCVQALEAFYQRVSQG